MNLESLLLSHGEILFPQLVCEKLSEGQASLVAMTNPADRFENQTYGYFGFWKMSANPPENRALFEKFQNWCLHRRCAWMLGPLDISTFFSYRLRLNPEQRPPFWGEPGNSQKEIDFLNELGFQPVQLYETLSFREIEDLRKELGKLGTVAEKAMKNSGLQISSVTADDLRRRSDEFYQITESIFSENAFYLSIPKDLFTKFFTEALGSLMDFDSSKILLDSQSRIVGYSLLLRDPANPKHLLVKSVGVAKAHRQMGLSFLALVNAGFRDLKFPYEKVSFCLMRENNFPSLVSKRLTGEMTKYALFGRKTVSQ